MIENKYEEIVDRYTDSDGRFNVVKSMMFLEMMTNLNQDFSVVVKNNAWRSNKMLIKLITKKIKLEIEQRDNLYETSTDENNEMGTKNENEDNILTIGTVPDKGTCSNYWNPYSYDLEMK